ncbi:MAG: hybrid sensor histidine kinase/response regulator [Polyangiaceae bacterium]
MTGLVLLVDDDDANLVVSEATLDFAECITANNAASALELLRTREVAVLLTDQRMPGMTGVELCEVASRESPDTVRILVTAYSDLKASIDAINLGQVRRYLRKPWEPEELAAEIRDALDVYTMTQQLREAEQRLRRTERVYTLGIASASMVHEVKNAMSGLVSSYEFVETVLMQVRDELARPQPDVNSVRKLLTGVEEAMEDAADGSRRVADIVAAVAAPASEASVFEIIDLADVVRVSLRIVHAELRHRAGLVVESKGGGGVRGSSTKLGQVVVNLLVNAMQAFGDRPRHQNTVFVEVGRDDTHSYVRVADNGPGVSAAIRDKLFDPFVSTKGEHGSGLGLSICKRLVEEHGGTLTVDDRPGGGASFLMRIPRAE